MEVASKTDRIQRERRYLASARVNHSEGERALLRRLPRIAVNDNAKAKVVAP